VNTMKELVHRWNPDVLGAAPVKKYVNTSLDNIEESIKELFYYRENFLKVKYFPASRKNHSVCKDKFGNNTKKSSALQICDLPVK